MHLQLGGEATNKRIYRKQKKSVHFNSRQMKKKKRKVADYSSV